MEKAKKSPHPTWAVKYRKPGTELRYINKRYYLYSVSKKYNKEKGKWQKVTGKILGNITKEHGFVPSKTRLLEQGKFPVRKNQQLHGKDFGHIALLESLSKDLLRELRKAFPSLWQNIFIMACSRIINQAPLNEVDFVYRSSFLAEKYPNARTSPKTLSAMLNIMGNQRANLVDFFKRFINTKNMHLLMDVTPITSKSKHLSINHKGYNSKFSFDPQVNLLMVFAKEIRMPVYYRLLPGNIREVASFKLSLKESGIKDAIIVADKGFYSKNNIQNLHEACLEYIIPLRRNSSLIDYGKLKETVVVSPQTCFEYKKIRIWCYEKVVDNKRVVLFLNNHLKAKEEDDYVGRIESCPEEYSQEGFRKKKDSFGTIALLTNLKKCPEEIYKTYKTRIEVEKMADVLKNILDVDRSYMRDEATLEGWMFINHIASIIYYRLANLLLEKKKLTRYSPKMILERARMVKKVKIDGEWVQTEIPTKERKLFESLGLLVT